MSIKDRLSYTVSVAKWKTDQQIRLVRSQNTMRDIENRIGALKTELAEIAIKLLSQEQLLHEKLNPTYEKIVNSEEKIKEQQDIQDKIRNEYPPKRPASLDELDKNSNGVLSCPECKELIVGKYCPKHGVEGIPLIAEPEEYSEITPKKICPKCKKELSVRFCPEHGLEGISE